MKSRIRNIFSFLESGLIERQIPARLSLLAALSGEHILIIGKPGTAKSELARRLHHVFDNATYFERLLTRFSVPEELFGPLSIKALEQDKYQRLTQHYLPQASIAFIDEIFKANSAILNALLTLLNEREFDNGSERVKTPLICVVAASNELPEDENLQALYDRFLLRYQVNPVADEYFDALLDLAESPHNDYQKLSLDDIQQIQMSARQVILTDTARQLMKALRSYLQQQSIYVSDRRWRKLLKLLQVAACTNGQTAITHWDCVLLLHAVWDKPEQLSGLQQWFYQYQHINYQDVIQRFEKLVSAWEQKTQTDAARYVHRKNDKGDKLYVTPEGEVTTQHEHVAVMLRHGEAVYKAPPPAKDRNNQGKGYTLAELSEHFFDDHYRQTHIEGKWVDLQQYVSNTQNRMSEHIVYQAVTDAFLFAAQYIAANRSEAMQIINDLQKFQSDFNTQYASLHQELEAHLWLADAMASDVLRPLHQVMARLASYENRMHAIIVNIDALKVLAQESTDLENTGI